MCGRVGWQLHFFYMGGWFFEFAEGNVTEFAFDLFWTENWCLVSPDKVPFSLNESSLSKTDEYGQRSILEHYLLYHKVKGFWSQQECLRLAANHRQHLMNRHMTTRQIAENIHYIHFSIQMVLISDKNWPKPFFNGDFKWNIL
jgi:hypothetical protein